MPTGHFQPPYPLDLTGEISAEIVDTGGSPTDVVRTGDNWGVDVRWILSGNLQAMIGGSWRLRLTLDELGASTKELITIPDLPLTPSNGDYAASIPVDPNQLQAVGAPRLFRALVTLQYLDLDGRPGPMAAYVDCGVVNLFPR